MGQSPFSDVNIRSGSRVILRLLRNPQVRYRSHNSPPQVPILSQIHPVHNFPANFPAATLYNI
jgi:hypothetical protein